MYNFGENILKNEDFMQGSEFEKSSKSNGLPSQICIFLFFWKFCYALLKFSIGNPSIDQNKIIKLVLIFRDYIVHA